MFRRPRLVSPMPAPLQVTGPECGRQFEAPASMRGGIANCPACRRAVPVPGGPELLFRVLISGGVLLILAALGFHAWGSRDTPVVVLALSIASITYGALLGAYVLASRFPRVRGPDVTGATAVTLVAMLVVVFAERLAEVPVLAWLAPLGGLAWPWYVPLGTLLAFGTGVGLSYLHSNRPAGAPLRRE